MRKLHSLSGVVPVGAFLLVHLWTNAKALRGQRSFDDAVADIHHLPYLVLFEAGILLPLAFHAIYGVKLALEARVNVGRYGYARNWMYTLQRVTGIVALVFILYHLYEFRLQKALGTMAAGAFYPTLCAHLSSTAFGVPVIALAYVIGIAASTFHFANGLWGFCCSWGVTISPRAQRLSATVFGVVGLAVFLLGLNTTLYFATGSRFFVPSNHAEGDTPHSCADVPVKERVAALSTRDGLPPFPSVEQSPTGPTHPASGPQPQDDSNHRLKAFRTWQRPRAPPVAATKRVASSSSAAGSPG